MRRIAEKVFTTSGTWVCPAGVTSVDVFIMAAGGGGSGGGGGAGASAANHGGGGGASGTPGSDGYNMTTTFDVIPGTGYSIIVGTGGAGGTGGAAGAIGSAGRITNCR